MMQEAIEIATELMDKKVRTFAERETASKRKLENISRTTRNQQQQQHSNKRQNTGRVYAAASGGKKQYGGSKSLCAKCNYHHDGPCAPKCHNCNKIGHLARDCRVTVNTNNANNQRDTKLGQKPTCCEYGVKGHYRSECPKLKINNNHGNQGGRNNAPTRVYAIGREGIDPDANVVMGAAEPPSPDYVPDPKHPPLPVYIPEPEYPEYLVPSGDEAPVEDQPLLVDASSTALSLGYVADSNLDEDQDEDPEEDHTDYPANEGMDEDGDKKEEHPALADPSAIHVVDPVSSAEDTKAFETDESTPTPRSPQTHVLFSHTRLCRARKIVRLEPHMSASIEAHITEHAVVHTPPLPVSSTPLPLPSPLTTSPTDIGAPLGYKVARIRMRDLLPSTYYRTDIPDADMPPQKRACFTTLALELEVGESSAVGVARQPRPTLEADLRRDRVEDMGYGITDTWDEIVEAMLDIVPTTLEGVNQWVTELATTVRDMRFHRHTVMLLDRDVTYARRAWTSFEDKSAAIESHVKTLEAHVAILIAQTSSLQTQLTTTLGRIETLEARDLEPRDEPAEAGNSSQRKRTTRTSPATTTTTTAHVTDAQLRALIAGGVAAALAERDADRSRNGADIKGTEGVVSLTQWAVRHDIAYAMPWKTLKKMMTDKYCLRSKIKKLYVGGLLDMIHGSMKASKPKTMQEAIEFKTELMDKKIPTLVERQAENKRKFEDTSRNNQNQQQPFKRNNVARAYTAGPGLAIRPVTVKAGLLLLTTTRELKGKIKEFLLALSVELRVISRVISKAKERKSGKSSWKCSLIDIIPTTLDHGYDVELANGRIIWSKQEHEEHLKLILELLKKEQLYAKFSKCEFWIPKVQFLGYVIDSEGAAEPPSPDYVPDPEHPPLPVYIPEPEYPEYLVPSGDEAPVEDQPLLVDASLTALSLGYVADSNLDEDQDEDPEEDHTDYPVNEGDGDDEPSDDDDDDNDTDDEDEEAFEDKDDDEKEEHPALADPSAIHVVDPVSSAEDTKAFETDESAPTPRSPQTHVPFSYTRLRRARKIVRLEPPMSASIEAHIAEHAVAHTPPLPVSSTPLPLPSPLTTSPTDTGAPLGYKVARIRMRDLLPSTYYRTDIPDADMPPQKRACFTTLALELEVGESSAVGVTRQSRPTLEADLRRDRVEDMGYEITDTWDEIVEAMLEIAPTTLEGVNHWVTELATTVRDMRFHRHTVMLLDREVTYARRAWTSFKDKSAAIESHVKTLEAHVAILIAQTSSLQTQLTTTLGRIETLEARDPEPRDEPAEAGSSSQRKRTTRTSPATTTTTTAHVTDAQLRALITRGVAAALAERDADRSRNGADIHDSGTCGRKKVSTICECTYTNFLKCQPMNIKGTEGVVSLTQWAVRHDIAYAMPWKTLKKMMTDKYCLRSGLLDMIHGSVKASKPKTMQEAIEFKTELMDKKIPTLVERQAENKRKFEDFTKQPKPTTAIQKEQCGTSLHCWACALTAKGLAIRPVTVKAGLLLLTTTRELKGKIKEFSLALSVELRVISRVISKAKERKSVKSSWNWTKCTMFTDRKSLQHILDKKELKMRQRHWLELLSDYDCEIRYHPGKANVVAGALSRKETNK
nr:putative reverse transcriptase domain-containing protein [Tanacetum cinerariifolium]